MAALWCELTRDWSPLRGRYAASQISGGILLAPQGSYDPEAFELRALPLRPMLPGFAVNTLLYGTLLWLVIPGPFALRRHIRRKRGLCVACGYDLRHADHAACPECGRRRDAAAS